MKTTLHLQLIYHHQIQQRIKKPFRISIVKNSFRNILQHHLRHLVKLGQRHSTQITRLVILSDSILTFGVSDREQMFSGAIQIGRSAIKRYYTTMLRIDMTCMKEVGHGKEKVVVDQDIDQDNLHFGFKVVKLMDLGVQEPIFTCCRILLE